MNKKMNKIANDSIDKGDKNDKIITKLEGGI